jgi:threonine aldolase
MANRLALQSLAGERRRVLVSRESHTYNDEGDGPQRLSGLSLVMARAEWCGPRGRRRVLHCIT